jgi:hypothetical protein
MLGRGVSKETPFCAKETITKQGIQHHHVPRCPLPKRAARKDKILTPSPISHKRGRNREFLEFLRCFLAAGELAVLLYRAHLE